ncbi:ABC transporter ATP-binding protein [Streptomyces sp. NBC_01320]|uniref:ABC transporter ATP-binding protein n=1 Tax=Streptomyces sp. NBC_01320 TaxID=2903824 RepID=UPI002E12D62E|nr:ABC transporter ATP-binding protein [Streptomyces sp. NBC_01320]
MTEIAATGADQQDTALEVRGVGQRYGANQVLSDIGFTLRRGELLATVGPNGAGKTTLFNCITGVSRPKAGSVLIGGTNITGRRPSAIVKAGVARTFQHLALFESLTVRDNLLMGRRHAMHPGPISTTLRPLRARREEAENREVVADLMERFALTGVADQLVETLPHGVGKVLELARAVAMEPSVLLLDEPVAGLNPEESLEFAEHLKVIRSERPDLAILLIEHDMPLVLTLADRVLVLNFGREVATGTPSEIQQDQRVIDAYLGRRSKA